MSSRKRYNRFPLIRDLFFCSTDQRKLCRVETLRCCFCSVVKEGLSWQHPSLPDQPGCVIDLCFCFTPTSPKKVEVLEHSGSLHRDQSVCVNVYTACVCVAGWANMKGFVSRKLQSLVIKEALPAKSFPLGPRGDFVVHLTRLLMHFLLI